jgi:hypothetical protein
MPYLNPEIFPDDWEALINTEEDCCEELRRAVRQLWLRQLSANRISTQNDAQLQNAQVHFGASCRMLTVVDRIPDPVPAEVTDPAVSQPPPITQRIYIVAGGWLEVVSGAASPYANRVQRFSLAGLVVSLISQAVAHRRYHPIIAGFSSETHGYSNQTCWNNQALNRIQFSDESQSVVSIGISPSGSGPAEPLGSGYQATRGAGSTHKGWFLEFLLNNNVVTYQITDFSFLSEMRIGSAIAADHDMRHCGVGQSDLHLYLAGGIDTDGTYHTRIQRLAKADNAYSVLSEQLDTPRNASNYFSSATKSYFLGTWNHTSIEALTHATETVATLGVSLSQVRPLAACESAIGSGFTFGGYIFPFPAVMPPFSRAIERFDLATETLSLLSNELQMPTAFGVALKSQ